MPLSDWDNRRGALPVMGRAQRRRAGSARSASLHTPRRSQRRQLTASRCCRREKDTRDRSLSFPDFQRLCETKLGVVRLGDMLCLERALASGHWAAPAARLSGLGRAPVGTHKILHRASGTTSH